MFVTTEDRMNDGIFLLDCGQNKYVVYCPQHGYIPEIQDKGLFYEVKPYNIELGKVVLYGNAEYYNTMGEAQERYNKLKDSIIDAFVQVHLVYKGLEL